MRSLVAQAQAAELQREQIIAGEIVSDAGTGPDCDP